MCGKKSLSLMKKMGISNGEKVLLMSYGSDIWGLDNSVKCKEWMSWKSNV